METKSTSTEYREESKYQFGSAVHSKGTSLQLQEISLLLMDEKICGFSVELNG